MRRYALMALLAASVAGCQEQASQPLIFGQGISFGVVMGAAAQAGNTPELTVGMKMVDIAIVPTVIGLPDAVLREAVANGAKFDRLMASDRRITGNRDVQLSDGKPTEYGSQDALSTFGSFSSSTESGSVKLGVFFATGVAAQSLAEGFKCGVGPQHEDCTSDAGQPQAEQ